MPSRRRLAGRAELAEYVAEPGAVAELLELRAERRAVRPILRTGDVPHVCLPAARIAPSLQARPPSASDRRRVLVTVKTVAGRNVAQQPLAPLIGAGTVHHQPKRPATSRDGAPEMPPYVRILGRAEDEPLHTIRPYAIARRAIGLLAGRGCRPARDRQYRERDGQQPAHTRERSHHTGRTNEPVVVRFPTALILHALPKDA
jgi:hypothetical protein